MKNKTKKDHDVNGKFKFSMEVFGLPESAANKLSDFMETLFSEEFANFEHGWAVVPEKEGEDEQERS